MQIGILFFMFVLFSNETLIWYSLRLDGPGGFFAHIADGQGRDGGCIIKELHVKNNWNCLPSSLPLSYLCPESRLQAFYSTLTSMNASLWSETDFLACALCGAGWKPGQGQVGTWSLDSFSSSLPPLHQWSYRKELNSTNIYCAYYGLMLAICS